MASLGRQVLPGVVAVVDVRIEDRHLRRGEGERDGQRQEQGGGTGEHSHIFMV